MLSRQPALYGVFLALAAGTLFSFGSLTVRLSPALDAVQYLLWRCIGLLPLMVIVALLQGKSPIAQIKAGGWLGFAGAVCMTLMAGLFIFAMKTTTIANALLFSSASPLFAAILARLILKERIMLLTWLGIAVGIVGLLIMSWGEIGAGNMIGNIAAFSVSLAYGLYSIIARVGRDRDMSGVMIGWSGLTILTCGALMLATGSSFATPMNQNAAALVHGIVLIGGGMFLLNRAARFVGAGRLLLLAQTETILGPVWVLLVFAEVPRLSTIIGGAVLLAGVVLSAFARSETPAPAEEEAEVAARASV
jgi:drug/metabolite transporter, DME family